MIGAVLLQEEGGHIAALALLNEELAGGLHLITHAGEIKHLNLIALDPEVGAKGSYCVAFNV